MNFVCYWKCWVNFCHWLSLLHDHYMVNGVGDLVNMEICCPCRRNLKLLRKTGNQAFLKFFKHKLLVSWTKWSLDETLVTTWLAVDFCLVRNHIYYTWQQWSVIFLYIVILKFWTKYKIIIIYASNVDLIFHRLNVCQWLVKKWSVFTFHMSEVSSLLLECHIGPDYSGHCRQVVSVWRPYLVLLEGPLGLQWSL
jgi:hypothetical protein